jgi:hypothetical protein
MYGRACMSIHGHICAAHTTHSCNQLQPGSPRTLAHAPVAVLMAGSSRRVLDSTLEPPLKPPLPVFNGRPHASLQ